jgi:hypothetical protein
VRGPAKLAQPFCLGLLRQRSVPLPTWRGWLVLLLGAALVCGIAMRWACAFLTVNDSVPGGVLVVEGWMMPTDAKVALTEFQRGGYSGLYVTGEPIDKDSPLNAYNSYAEMTADTLRGLGANPATLHAVPAPKVIRDRTYSTAFALKKALLADGVSIAKVNLLSDATHSRRSRLLYEKAFGPATRVGVIPVRERDFDPDRWWTTSAGVRTVVSELIAYAYARFLFTPEPE